MTEQDRMKHLNEIERIANICGFQNRRYCVRSLTSIQIFDESSREWVLFDPVARGKDLSRTLYALFKIEHPGIGKYDFRLKLLRGIIDENAVS